MYYEFIHVHTCSLKGFFAHVEAFSHNFLPFVCFYLFTFRTKPTLSGKQKRQLQEKLEYVQEVVKTKKVGCVFGLRRLFKDYY